ncbi:hypothetical protein TIFTF001_047566 [Ficus carica]|uniref:Uncharacterized protein n=1 Tax=Ficus carica TaxID=3494 RepID=A0AA88CNL3_FICCA|nr:hypothetical protein TIFTF001_047566 [Ficus carica]
MPALKNIKRLSGASLLILANKQDIKGALSPEEIAKVLNLEAMDKTRHWRIVGCSAYTGEGLIEGFDWYVEGGMGSVSLAIGNAAKEAGAHIITRADVKQLLVEDSGRVNGVLLGDGMPVHSLIVLSNATPYKTFKELTPDDVLPDDFIRAIKNSDYSSAGFEKRKFGHGKPN